MPTADAAAAAGSFRDRLRDSVVEMRDLGSLGVGLGRTMLGASTQAASLFLQFKSLKLVIASIAAQGLVKMVRFIAESRKEGLGLVDTFKKAQRELGGMVSKLSEASKQIKGGGEATGAMARGSNLAQKGFDGVMRRTRLTASALKLAGAATLGIVVAAKAGTNAFREWSQQVADTQKRLAEIERSTQGAAANLSQGRGGNIKGIRSLISSSALGRLSEEQSAQLIGAVSSGAPGADRDAIAGTVTSLARADLAGFDPQQLAATAGGAVALGADGRTAAEIAARASRSGADRQLSSLLNSSRRSLTSGGQAQLVPLLKAAAAEGPAAIDALQQAVSAFADRGEAGSLSGLLRATSATGNRAQREAGRATLSRLEGGDRLSVIEQGLGGVLADPESRVRIGAQVTQAQAGRLQTERLRESALEEDAQAALESLTLEQSGTARFLKGVPLIGRLRSRGFRGEFSDIDEQRVQDQLMVTMEQQFRVLQDIAANTASRRLQRGAQTE